MEKIFNQPIVIFTMGSLMAVGGNYVSNQLSQSTSISSNSVRLTALEEYRNEHSKSSVTRDELNRLEMALKDTQRNYVTKDEFNAAFNSLLRAVTELRDEIRERKTR